MTPLSVARLIIEGRDRADFSVASACAGRVIAVDGGCVVTVRFTPHGTGERTAQVVIRVTRPGTASPLGPSRSAKAETAPAISTALLSGQGQAGPAPRSMRRAQVGAGAAG